MEFVNKFNEFLSKATGRYNFSVNNKNKEEIGYSGINNGEGETVIVQIDKNRSAIYKVYSKPINGYSKKKNWTFQFIKFLE